MTFRLPTTSSSVSPKGKGRRAARAGQRGFTLIEVVGVVSIIALLATAVALSIRDVVRVNLRAESHKVAANIQAAYNRAITRNAYYRLVFDLETNEYWSELAEDRFFLSSKMEEDDESSSFKKKESSKSRAGEVQILEMEESDTPAMHRASGQEIKDGLIKRVKLGKGLRIGGILTTHQEDLRTEGKGYLYVFPNGYVERALIYITDDEQVYTVSTQPLTGRVQILKGEIEPGSDFYPEDED